MTQASKTNGKIYLIGAGPGDPGLLTLRGAELLGRSDVVLFDGLSNQELLKHAPTAEHICVGKHGQKRIWKQHEIIAEMLRHAQAGKTVARLKGGDPAVFARTAEEVDALRDANVEFEIVPGITAALAAGSYAGIPITHRKLASAVALVTGHEEPGKPESALDWDALARFPGTLVIYMGVTTAAVWTKALMDAGKPGETPAALIRRCSHGDQQTIQCRLDEVAQRLTPASKFRPPVITILGPVTQLAQTMNWLERRPLFGKTILVTRPQNQAAELAEPLRDLGANVLHQPAIEISPLADPTELDQAIESISEFDFVVFCSRNGVKFFFDQLWQDGRDLRQLCTTKIAVVGKRTAQALRAYYINADMVPKDFSAQSLGKAMAAESRGKRVLVIRASRGKDDLEQELTRGGAIVQQVVAYEHRDIDQADPAIANALAAGAIDWITVTSSATANNLHRLFGGAMGQAKIASISPVTTAVLESLGLPVAAQADPHTMQGIMDAIQRHEAS